MPFAMIGFFLGVKYPGRLYGDIVVFNLNQTINGA
jgi:hypothetical protein